MTACRAGARHGRPGTHGRPCSHARSNARPCVRPCHLARPGRATSLVGRSFWVLVARSVRPISCPCLRLFCACCPLFCFPWSSGLPRTSNLSWNCSWSLLFYQNLMISPEMKSERVLGIRSKRGQFDPNSTRFNIKRMRIRDQISAKIGSNKGLTPIILMLLLWPSL